MTYGKDHWGFGEHMLGEMLFYWLNDKLSERFGKRVCETLVRRLGEAMGEWLCERMGERLGERVRGLVKICLRTFKTSFNSGKS